MNINFVFRFEVSYPFIFSKRAQRVIHCFLKSKIFSADWFIASNLLLFCTMSNRFSLPGGKTILRCLAVKFYFILFSNFPNARREKVTLKTTAHSASIKSHNRCTIIVQCFDAESTRCEHPNETDTKDFFQPESTANVNEGKKRAKGIFEIA